MKPPMIVSGRFATCASRKASLYPRQHRELLRAIVAVRLGISYWKVNLKALDKAYSIAFPNSTPINVNKKKRNNDRSNK